MNERLEKRLQGGIKKYGPILRNAKTKDVNESDTVVIITDMLSEIFGYDKYSEITSEVASQSSNNLLAVTIQEKIKLLIECKAIGIELKEDHLKKACDYGLNLGIDWLILSNGKHWKIYKIVPSKQVALELIYEFNFLELSSKNKSDIENLYHITKESVSKSHLEKYYNQRQITSKHFIGQLVLSEKITEAIRRELRKISPQIKIDTKEIKNILETEVLKREIIEGETAEIIKKKVNKEIRKITRKNREKAKASF